MGVEISLKAAASITIIPAGLVRVLAGRNCGASPPEDIPYLINLFEFSQKNKQNFCGVETKAQTLHKSINPINKQPINNHSGLFIY